MRMVDGRWKKLSLWMVGCLLCVVAVAKVTDKPFVVPELKQWVGNEGYLLLNEHARVVYNPKQPELLRIAKLLADDYASMFGRKLEVVAGKSQKGDIEMSLKSDKQLGKEGYSIKISDRVTISAPEPEGIYWSTRTLLQIAEQNENRQLSKGLIRDYPDYPLRGFMIDCGRKFIPLSYLQDLVKVMAYYKMNTLQVHLNDNGFKQYFEHDWSKTYAAFRLESETYPGLAAFDGYYTKKEFREFQKQAMELGVEIIPEIDVPAHSLAFSHYKPEIGSKKYGMDHLDLFAPETYPFVDALFKEYLEGDDPVFCGKRVHVGTDEYSNETQELVEKFREFTDHCIRLVEGYGKQACMWGALSYAKGETPVKSENVVMSLWSTGFAHPKDMIREGYQLISMYDRSVYIVPGAPYYHDYLDVEKLYKEWTPASIGKDQFEEKSPSILGGMFALWNDHVGNGISVKDIHHRIYPALQTLSVKMWTGKDTLLPYGEFDMMRAAISEAPGVNVLGRIGKVPSLVYEKEEISAGMQTGVPEIGYNYTVTFELQGADETLGTELFRSDNAVFYLSDPVKGMLGFARDGYLNTFRYKVHDGEQSRIQIEGDNRSTTLKVNGKTVDHLNIGMRYYNQGKDSMEHVRTLVFPLEKAGDFKSRIKNLKVYNYCKE
ncbi:family 20 glycosylhydrolase [Bacteroides sp.]